MMAMITMNSLSPADKTMNMEEDKAILCQYLRVIDGYTDSDRFIINMHLVIVSCNVLFDAFHS
jgi:hypothetical protein